jgi:hypothetical protein
MVVVLLVSVASSAAAASPSAPADFHPLTLPPPSSSSSWSEQEPFEPGVAAGQLAGGTGVAVAGVALIALGNVAGTGALTMPVVMGIPALVGLTVCHIGGSSSYYDAPCGPVIGGAFVGALSVVPLALIGLQLDRSENDEGFSGTAGLAVGALVGWVIVQPLAATVAWRLFRHPRRTAIAAAPRTAAVPPGRLRASERAPGQLTLPLFSTGF